MSISNRPLQPASHSHSTTWGYNNTYDNEDLVDQDEWSDAHHLSLIHDPKLPYSFNSSRLKRGYNHDISFVSNNVASLNNNAVLEHTRHRPIAMCDIDPPPENYDRFAEVVHATARKHIPRGCLLCPGIHHRPGRAVQ